MLLLLVLGCLQEIHCNHHIRNHSHSTVMVPGLEWQLGLGRIAGGWGTRWLVRTVLDVTDVPDLAGGCGGLMLL